MKMKKIIDSFNYAAEGLIYSVRTQRNMRFHLVAALLVILACFFFKISKVELLILFIAMTMVIAAEMVNTAIECTIDATTNYYHPLAKIAKNVAAGAVLLTAFNAIFVGYLIFGDKLQVLSFSMISKLKNSNPYAVFLILIVVIIFTIIVKAIYGEGTPFKGGMPSGHASIGFSIATMIALFTKEPLAIFLSYILALIVAQSRVDSEVHSVAEVIIGAIFGTLLTVLIFVAFLK